MKYIKYLLLFFALVFIDQSLKIFVKTHLTNGDEIRLIGTSIRLHFIENDGSNQLIGRYTQRNYTAIIFYLFTFILLFYATYKLIKNRYHSWAIVGCLLLLSGCAGNQIDKLFYGLFFTDSPYNCFSGNYDSITSFFHNYNNQENTIAHLCSFGHGYGKFMEGRNVCMIYLPICEIPEYIPIYGRMLIFEPVFNLADAYIVIGLFVLSISNKKRKDLNHA